MTTGTVLRLFKKLTLNNQARVAYSAAIDMSMANAVLVTFVVEAISASGAEDDIAITLQESNDAQNWLDTGGSQSEQTAGYYQMNPFTDVESRYVRVRCDFTPGSDDSYVDLSVTAALYNS